jgi:hypothetical protein
MTDSEKHETKNVSRTGTGRNVYRILMVKSLGKRALGKPRRR